MHNKFYVTLIQQHIRLYAVNSPENNIIMRTLDKDRANSVAFLLNNKTEIFNIIKHFCFENPVSDLIDSIKKIQDHYSELNDHSKPF